MRRLCSRVRLEANLGNKSHELLMKIKGMILNFVWRRVSLYLQVFVVFMVLL